MDKQKSYGQNYQPKRVRRRLRASFVLGTIIACVLAAIVVTVLAKAQGI